MVAILGWIIPAPLVQPSNRIVRPDSVQRDAAHFGRVSVVMMALVNPPNPSTVRSAIFARAGTACKIRSTRHGRPITPVEQTNTFAGSQPISRAIACAVASDAAIPASPVAQLAFRELTITARIRGAAFCKCRRQRTTGAACTRFCVKTPAAATSSSAMISPRSRFGAFRRPQFIAAKRKPCGSAESGTVYIWGISLVTQEPPLADRIGPLLQTRVAIVDGFSIARRSRSSGHVAARQRRFKRQYLRQIGFKEGREA